MVTKISRLAAATAIVGAGLLASAGGLTLADAASTTSMPTVTVTQTGKTIAVMGNLVSGAVNVVTTTTGEQAGSTVFFAMKPGVTPAQVEAVLAQKRTQNSPDYLDSLGSIVYDAEVPQGVAQIQTVLAPGNYLALDAGSVNDPSKAPTTTFTVSANAQPAALSTPDATISAIDFGFRSPNTLRRGSLLRVENDGFVVHMVLALPVPNAKTARRLSAMLRAGQDRKAQKLVTGPPVGLTGGPLSTGAVQQGVLQAKPGYYVLACFMDTQDGREHTRLGMERTVRITG